MKAKTETFNGHTIGYDRRRYGTTTYTWAHVIEADGTWKVLGDPWPATRVPRVVLADKIGQYEDDQKGIQRYKVMDE